MIVVAERFVTGRAGPRFSIVELATGKEPYSRDQQTASTSLGEMPLFSPDGQWIAAIGGGRPQSGGSFSTGQI